MTCSEVSTGSFASTAIDDVLLELPAVAETCVVGHDDEKGLTAWFE